MMNLHPPATDAIINPQKGKKSPNLEPLAVMISSQKDFSDLCTLIQVKETSCSSIMMSKIYYENKEGKISSIAGPAVSAPYAVMLLETMIAWGARQFIFVGWCGSISHSVKIGDIIIPDRAFIDEGTSRHYLVSDNYSVPSENVNAFLQTFLTTHQIPFHIGSIWTTDAVYRETVEKVKFYQSQEVLAVEMELSALFTVAKFRGVDIGAVLVVSDELATYQWIPGFKNERFLNSRAMILQSIKEICQQTIQL